MESCKQISEAETPSSEQAARSADCPAAAGAFCRISHELKSHMPFTFFGALTGIGILAVFVTVDVPSGVSTRLFWSLHPLHVLMSAVTTTAMFTLHSRRAVLATLVIGYVGSVGIGTLSDCLIPYVGEVLLDLPHRGIHLGFIEKWWLVNPLAVMGILAGYSWPRTKIAHAGHVLLSTWASLFHMIMALGADLPLATYVPITVFLFLAVWIPCCTSDIVFPLLFAKK